MQPAAYCCLLFFCEFAVCGGGWMNNSSEMHWLTVPFAIQWKKVFFLPVTMQDYVEKDNSDE